MNGVLIQPFRNGSAMTGRVLRRVWEENAAHDSALLAGYGSHDAPLNKAVYAAAQLS